MAMLSEHDKAQIQQEVARAFHTLVSEKCLHPALVLAIMCVFHVMAGIDSTG